MTGKYVLPATRLLKYGVIAGALLIVAAVAYGGFNRDSQSPESTDRSFATTGSECEDLDLDQYSIVFAPVYLPWEPPAEASSERNQRDARVTCTSQAVIDEELCEDDEGDECTDWYHESPSIVNRFRVTIKYYESTERAGESTEITTGSGAVQASGRWTQVYESSDQQSGKHHAELTSIFLADNMTIEVHSAIGTPVQTEAIIAETFTAHSSLAETIAQGAEL